MATKKVNASGVKSSLQTGTPPFWRLAFSKRLAPLFLTQFNGAFNDNVYKNAFVVILVYRLLKDDAAQSAILVNLTQAVFILPYILFAAIAGNIGDVYDKAMLIRRIKLAEILIVIIAAGALFFNNIPTLIFVVFLLSVQSTFFGPLKYGIVPQHVSPDSLVNSNALISAGTFIAIVAGTLIGAYGATLPQYAGWVSSVLLAFALFGYLASRFIPKAPPVASVYAGKSGRLSYDPFGSTLHLLRSIYGKQPQYRPYLLGVSWFWFVGSVLITQIPILAKELKLEDLSVSFFMIMFATGIAGGALVTGLVLRNKPTSKYAAISALCMTLASLDMILAMHQFDADALLLSNSLSSQAGDEISVPAFLSQGQGIRLCLDFFLLSLFGGFYVIPLFTVLVRLAKPEERAKVIAANNIFNAFFMVGSALAVMLIYVFGGSIFNVLPMITVSAILVSLFWAIHRHTRRSAI